MQEGTQGSGSHASDSAERAGEVALIGKAGAKADFGERSARHEHALARCADAETMNEFADAFTDAAAEDAGEMDGVDTGFARELVEDKATAMVGV